MNAVDAIYKATDWNADGRDSVGGTGSLRVIFSEIHVINSFTGDYASLKPDKQEHLDCPLDDDGTTFRAFL